jgi:hypothetical protein
MKATLLPLLLLAAITITARATPYSVSNFNQSNWWIEWESFIWNAPADAVWVDMYVDNILQGGGSFNNAGQDASGPGMSFFGYVGSEPAVAIGPHTAHFVLFTLSNPEGIQVDADGYVVAPPVPDEGSVSAGLITLFGACILLRRKQFSRIPVRP